MWCKDKKIKTIRQYSKEVILKTAVVAYTNICIAMRLLQNVV